MMALFWVSIGVLFYVYAGYPLLLRLIVWARGARRVAVEPICPSVSLVVSAYNEAAVIRQKLENALRLDYPRDRLEVLVVSDASTDGTDEIVGEYADRGVRLIRQPGRQGKTAGLNRAVGEARGEIVVFSDANAIYEAAAVRNLVRNFADPAVGCVTGEARYLEGGHGTADAGERAYWNYEIYVKRLETAVGSMVGGDGAIYAIRRALWRPLPADAINDFLNPLQIVAAGWRAVYEPEAICFEETAGGLRSEYRRRIRIVSRSWRAIFQAPRVLNPFAVGFFTVSLLSHKVLRWFSGLFALAALGSLALVLPGLLRIPAAVAGGAALLAFGVGLLWRRGRQLLEFSVYFAVITSASVVGLFKGSFGRVSGTWQTPRETAASPSLFAPAPVLVAMSGAGIAGVALFAMLAGMPAALEATFWLSLLLLVYVYALYPAILLRLSVTARRGVQLARIEPEVCLFITANDEQTVIADKLLNALALDYPADKLRILVASDGSVDRTNAIVRSFESRGVQLLAFPVRRGKIAAINEGIGAVTEPIVVFSDANTFLDRQAIRAIVRNFADPSVGAVSGDVVLQGHRAALGTSEDLYYRYERRLQACESEIGTMVGVDGALYAIRRPLFVPPPADTILDDMAIPMAVARAGLRVVFEPEARAQERGSDSATEEFVRKSRVVAGAVQFLRRPQSAVPQQNRQLIFTLISHKALRWLSPAFATATLVSAIALAPQSRLYLAMAAVQGLFLLAGLAGCWPAARGIRLVGIAHYFWLVQAAAAVGFVRGLCGSQPVAWRRFQRAPMGAA